METNDASEYQCQECAARYTCEETAASFSRCPTCGAQIVWRPAEVDPAEEVTHATQ